MNAGLVGINFATGDVHYFLYDGEFAIEQCLGLKKSIAADWPGMVFAVVADDEAKLARQNRILQAFGMLVISEVKEGDNVTTCVNY